MHTCPNCGNNIKELDVYICPECNFDFNSTVSCPYKISNKCVHKKIECTINGLDYELCKLYLHCSGITK